MAIPISGTLTMSRIWEELHNEPWVGDNTSLAKLFSEANVNGFHPGPRANLDPPYKMSEFYGYELAPIYRWFPDPSKPAFCEQGEDVRVIENFVWQARWVSEIGGQGIYFSGVEYSGNIIPPGIPFNEQFSGNGANVNLGYYGPWNAIHVGDEISITNVRLLTSGGGGYQGVIRTDIVDSFDISIISNPSPNGTFTIMVTGLNPMIITHNYPSN